MKYVIMMIVICMGLHVTAQQKNMAYEKHWLYTDNDTMPYRLLLPLNYDKSKQYPIIIFLHGSGERGNDNEAQLIHGAALFLRDSIRTKYPAIIVFPQCSNNSYWSNVNIVKNDSTGERLFQFQKDGPPTKAMQLLTKLMHTLHQNYRINKKQQYVMGLSMGGMGTFEFVYRNPKQFAAAISICGGANTAITSKIATTNWWLFHGEKDDVVLPAYSKAIAAALLQYNKNTLLTLYPNANHNSWDSAFAENNLLHWLFANKLK